nr:immunoglobulin light chain junction region [Macaca mulatta]
CQQYTNSPFSC